MEQQKMRKVIAVTGKGGCGKTAFVSILVKVLSDMGRILAIDGDSAGGLRYALGVNVDKTIGDLRKEIINNPEVRREVEDKHIRKTISGALTEGQDFKLLVMGRAEGPGCYCQINELLKYGIETLSKDFDFVLIDCEAGPEQISRRMLEKADILVIMVDNSVRSIQVAHVISNLTSEVLSKGFDKAGIIINRYGKGREEVEENVKQIGVEVFGYIPEDGNITEYDQSGRPLIELPETSPCVLAVKEFLDKLLY